MKAWASPPSTSAKTKSSRHMRTHGKALIGPVAVLIVLAAMLGGGLALMPADWNPWGTVALVAVLVVAKVAWVLVPFIRWWTTTYIDHESSHHHAPGPADADGHDPLARINDVTMSDTCSTDAGLRHAPPVDDRRRPGDPHRRPRRGARPCRDDRTAVRQPRAPAPFRPGVTLNRLRGSKGSEDLEGHVLGEDPAAGRFVGRVEAQRLESVALGDPAHEPAVGEDQCCAVVHAVATGEHPGRHR